ncbi:MAG: hypothetical protein P8Y18_07525 [Candidatus Bathyarchaeota archaeon]
MKIRRVDSDRREMFHEAEMMRIANSVNVGPKFVKASKNFLIMELIKGKYFPEWIKSLEEKDYQLLRKILRNILDQCYELDVFGLDHGDLSNAQIVKEKIGIRINKKKLVEILRIYKKSLNRYDFEKILDQIFY